MELTQVESEIYTYYIALIETDLSLKILPQKPVGSTVYMPQSSTKDMLRTNVLFLVDGKLTRIEAEIFQTSK